MEFFKQAELKYDFAALEPHIDAQTMELHYSKHHAGYTAKFNAALEPFTGIIEGKTAEDVLKMLDQFPEEARMGIQNNGGGYLNHNLYWETMTPGGKTLDDMSLLNAINNTFGDLNKFKAEFTQKAMSVFGSGWAWLVKDNQSGELSLRRTSFQNNPITKHDVTPLLTIDVWEHAYYLKHQNKRDQYIKDWFEVVDWSAVSNRFTL